MERNSLFFSFMEFLKILLSVENIMFSAVLVKHMVMTRTSSKKLYKAFRKASKENIVSLEIL